MKCKIPEISWHNRDPVLSVDIQPNRSNGINRLASGGTDAHVLIWYIKMTSGEKSDLELDLAADLTRHQRAVNVVKWSPNGELLASGDDESVVFIWKLKSDSEPVNILDTPNEQDKEVWITLKVLRGHMKDIYDLSWAPNSLFLVSGSVDNSAIMWDVIKGKSTAILNDHKGFVQGVAWDPKNQYIATLSTDRYLRIFDIQTKKVLQRIRKSTLPVSKDHNLHGKTVRLFHDDTLQTFFRRLCFTPDGKLLITPSGVTDYDGCTHPLNTTYVFSRYGFRHPAIVLPCPDQYTVAVRCCPKLYQLRPFDEKTNPPVVPLPYRMIFAVATKSSVYFYDTQQKQPFALISNIHYTRLTDITWSQDGVVVVVSSTDGFCSLITFEKGELGEEYEDSDAVLEAALAQVNAKNSKLKKQKDNESNTVKSRKPSLDSNNQPKESTTTKNVSSLEQVEEIGTKLHVEQVIEAKNDSNKVSTKSVIGDEKEREKPDTLIANPIPIKRKPPKENSQPIPCPIKPNSSPNTAQAIDSNPSEIKENTNEQCTPPKPSKPILPSKVLTSDIILDKEILSTDEKFESPEKKSRPATPISVRRHPRTPFQTPTQTIKSPTTFARMIKSHEDDSSPGEETKNQCKDKKANPIAVRRKPRTQVTMSSIVNTPPLVEEAMDAWPLNKETESDKKQNISLKETGVTPINSEETLDRTEDIRLVYEDTIEGTPTKTTKRSVSLESSTEKAITTENKIENVEKQETPTGKTPRRVALKTLSTPKSKKKILD